MISEQVAALAATGESETLEFKATTGQRSEAAKTMCAMLNTGGGYVLLGVTPEGKAIGQQVGRQTIEDVTAEIQRIDPPAFPTVERIRMEGDREVLPVQVTRGSATSSNSGWRWRGDGAVP